MTLVLPAVALPIVALKFWERTSAVPLPFAQHGGTPCGDSLDSIALHATPSIARHKGPDVACCQIGIAATTADSVITS